MAETELARFRKALAARGPNDMLLVFRHYPPGEVTDAHTPHPALRYLTVPLDDVAFAEVMTRMNNEFGDPSKDIGGPELPSMDGKTR